MDGTENKMDVHFPLSSIHLYDGKLNETDRITLLLCSNDIDLYLE